MSAMIEIFYRKPVDATHEQKIISIVTNHEGSVTYKEDDTQESICLTAEFDSWENAIAATATLRKIGEYVEGPADYGNS